MSFILQPGEFFDPTGMTIWKELTRTEPCAEPGCWHSAFYELDRTVIPGTVAQLDFRCDHHKPMFIVGSGQTIGLPLAAGGAISRYGSPIAKMVEDYLKQNNILPITIDEAPAKAPECDECWGTGRYRGTGRDCSHGCRKIP